ncbi:MAG: 2-amino-4-hydroxy-6-hydroxymethyldihydropteridine diphosphokinase [Elusimicrobia bacterium]|nr:2-amino-4-hydroxy-6-hydroxymethyldihydropteridine diphosphokinase [Elusimicrobiota bacterium]
MGSNVRPRRSRLRGAARALARLPGTRVVRASSVYETSPVGPAQADYLNAVVEIATGLPPVDLLRELKLLERALGRRPRAAGGPAKSISMFCFTGAAAHAPVSRCRTPHWRERRFVLEPLAGNRAAFSRSRRPARRWRGPGPN